MMHMIGNAYRTCVQTQVFHFRQAAFTGGGESEMRIRSLVCLLGMSAVLFFALVASALAVQVTNVAVSRVNSSDAIIVVKTDMVADVRIDYGSAPGVLTSTKASDTLLRHEVLLDGLAPSSTVFYQVTIADSADPTSLFTLPEKSFHTTRSTGQPFSFAVAGDNRPASDTTCLLYT